LSGRRRERVLILCVLALAGEALTGDFLSAPEVQSRPWPILKNTMATVHMRLFAVRTGQAPAIDGKLDEPQWDKAFSVSTFGLLGFKGYSGRKNAVRLLYDDQAIYIGCTGELGGWHDWLARARARDQGAWEDESFEVFLDPHRTRKTYYHFIVNAVGSIQDGKGWNDRYDPTWRVAVAHTERAYTVEMAIPYEAAEAKPPAKGDVWGINVCRNDKEASKSSSVIPVADSFHDPTRFAEILFGDAPEVYLDSFRFDRIIKGQNVLQFQALGTGLAGLRVRGEVSGPDGKAVAEARDAPLALSGFTSFPFTLSQAGTSRLWLDVMRGNETLGRYGFHVMMYEYRLLLLVPGGTDFYRGRSHIRLRFDLRLDPPALASCALRVALTAHGNLLREGRIERLPGPYLSTQMDISALTVGDYTIEAALLDRSDKELGTSRVPLRILEDPFAPAIAARAVPLAAEPPEQFEVWGTLGQQIQWRILDKATIDKLKTEGKTEAEIDYKRRYYDVREWPEVQLDSEKPALLPTDSERQRGYVIFGRHYMSRVYYYTVPRPDERLGALKAFAAQGEYEPITFAIHALRDIKQAKADVTSLRSGDAVLGKENLDVRVVRCYPKPFASPWWDPDKEDKKTRLPFKEVVPTVIEKRPVFDVPKGQSRQVWITLRAPQDCAPGVYAGSVNLSLDGQEERVPLSVRILPFPLLKLDKAAHLYSVPHERNAFVDYREHGFNVIEVPLRLAPADDTAIRNAFKEYLTKKDKAIKVPLPPTEEIFRANQATIDKALQLAAEAKLQLKKIYFVPCTWFIAGWTGTWDKYFPITPELDQKYADAVNRIIGYTQSKGFPEFIVIPGDEPGGHPETMPDVLHYLQLTKARVRGARTGMTVGGGMSMGIDEVGQLGPNLDVVITNYLNAAELRKVSQLGKELWIYNVGSATRNPQLDRHAYGFLAWKIGATGMAQWVYRGDSIYWMAYAASGDNWAYVFPSVEGKPLPTIHYETFREAIDDQRYGATLSRLIRLARASGDADAIEAATSAEGVIGDILAHFRLSFMDRRFPVGVLREFDTQSLDPDAFDAWRWRLAVEILKLQKALGAKAVLDAGRPELPLVPQDASPD